MTNEHNTNEHNDGHNNDGATGSDQELRGAFDRLRNDAAKVNPMAAMQQHEQKKTTPPWYASPGMLVGSLAAVALLVVGGVFVLGGDDPDNPEQIDTATEATPTPGAENVEPQPEPIDGFPFAGDWVLTVGVADGQEFWTGVEANGQATLLIESASGQVGGTAFCNGFGGQMHAVDFGDGVWGGDGPNVPIFGQMGGTQMGCEQPLMSLETTYLSALAAVDSMGFFGDEGELHLNGDGIDMTFERIPPIDSASFLDTTWVLETIISGDTATSTINGAEPATLRFSSDGTFVGHTGCRALLGEWTEVGGEILPTSWGADGECAPEFSRQDSAVIAVLEPGFVPSVSGDQLTLLNNDGTDGLVYRADTGGTAVPGEGIEDGEGIDAGDPDQPTPPPEDTETVPAATTFDDLACGEPAGGETQNAVTVDQVEDIISYDNVECRRTVFYMRSSTAGAGVVGGATIEVDVDGAGSRINVPVTLVFNYEVQGDFSAGAAVQAQDANRTPYLYVNHGEGTTTVTMANNPARIIVDTQLAAGGTRPITGLATIVPEPINQGGPGRTTPITVRGMGRPFEATGTVSLRRAPADGEAPGSGPLVDANWSGFSVAGDNIVDSRYAYMTPGSDAYGPFSFTMDGLAPGAYELLFENFAVDETNDAGLYVSFTVLDGPNTSDPTAERTMQLSPLGLEISPDLFVPWGTELDAVVQAVEEQLGSTGERQDIAECAVGATTYTFGDSLLTLSFNGTSFAGWSLGNSELATPSGIGVGSTLTELQTEWPGLEVLEDSTLGFEYFVEAEPDEFFSFLLDGDAAESTVSTMWAGATCTFR